METASEDTMMTRIGLKEVEVVIGIMITSKSMIADHKVGVEEVKGLKMTLMFLQHKEVEEEEVTGNQTSSKLMNIDERAGVVIGDRMTLNLNRANQEVEEQIGGFTTNLVDIGANKEEASLLLNNKARESSSFQKKMNS